MRILALIVTYNSADDITSCLESILKSSISTDVLVVDNGSLDNTVRIVENYSQVRLIKSKENSGYAGGNNIGLRYAMKEGYRYVFVANPDLIVEQDTIKILVSEAEKDSKVALLSPLITNSRMGGEVWYAGSNIDWKTGLTPHLCTVPELSKEHKKSYITGRACGAAMLINLGSVAEVGQMPEEYFLYYEEADWSQVFIRADYRVLVVPRSVAHHNVSASTGEESPLVWYYMIRNRLYFVKKFEPLQIASAEASVRREVYKNLRAWLRRPTKINLRRGRAVLKGYFDYKRKRMGKGWK